MTIGHLITQRLSSLPLSLYQVSAGPYLFKASLSNLNEEARTHTQTTPSRKNTHPPTQRLQCLLHQWQRRLEAIPDERAQRPTELLELHAVPAMRADRDDATGDTQGEHLHHTRCG
jgi:hypothetical protein